MSRCRVADLEIDGQLRYDVAILNEHDTARLPIGNYMFIGCRAPDRGRREARAKSSIMRVLWWDETHAILRHVALEYVYTSRRRWR